MTFLYRLLNTALLFGHSTFLGLKLDKDNAIPVEPHPIYGATEEAEVLGVVRV